MFEILYQRNKQCLFANSFRLQYHDIRYHTEREKNYYVPMHANVQTD